MPKGSLPLVIEKCGDSNPIYNSLCQKAHLVSTMPYPKRYQLILARPMEEIADHFNMVAVPVFSHRLSIPYFHSILSIPGAPWRIASLISGSSCPTTVLSMEGFPETETKKSFN